MFKKILVPTDGTQFSAHAVKSAIDFAAANGASVVVLTVADTYPLAQYIGDFMAPDREQFETGRRQMALRHTAEIATAAAAANVPCDTVVTQSDHPCLEIIDTAKKSGCDVIFMASHGRKGVSKLLLGSETQKVLVLSTIPVLVFPSPHD